MLTDEEGAALEPVGNELAAEGQEAVNQLFSELDDGFWDALSRNAGDLGGESTDVLSKELSEKAKEFYNLAVQNPNSDVGVIGLYKETPFYESYLTEARYLNASHINLQEPYLSEYYRVFGESKEAWRAWINRPYLEELWNSGKTVYLATPPESVPATSTAQWEINTLRELGYSLPVFDPLTGLYIMLP